MMLIVVPPSRWMILSVRYYHIEAGFWLVGESSRAFLASAAGVEETGLILVGCIDIPRVFRWTKLLDHIIEPFYSSRKNWTTIPIPGISKLERA